jgi:hypothetical protein
MKVGQMTTGDEQIIEFGDKLLYELKQVAINSGHQSYDFVSENEYDLVLVVDGHGVATWENSRQELSEGCKLTIPHGIGYSIESASDHNLTVEIYSINVSTTRGGWQNCMHRR